MKRRFYLLLSGLFVVGLLPFVTLAQSIGRREKYDIQKDKVLYTIGYAHLDTEWNWDYPAVIDEYIKKTMIDNFALFEKYPDYVFNFTGSRRYNMMKEYYPDLYKKVVDYVRQGRWYVVGSSVDEAEVNISSSESLLRQVLYGNLFFKREFGQQSTDYMLPDCFGFVATTPSVWAHAGLLGFSTQKLTWGSANGIPFNVGVWEGPDGKGLLAALNATSYNGDIVPRLDRDRNWTARMESNQKRYGLSFDYRYYGIGDQGGAPREKDVQNAVGSLRHGDSSHFKVILTAADQLFKDITPALRAKLPTYSGDLLLVEHSAGSLTSQAFMKRANRKNELLAKSAEQLSSVASWLGGESYPLDKLNHSWDLVLGSQFHDILSGTATPKSYEYAWNDEFIAMNGFSAAIQHSVSVLSHQLNTQTQGRAIVVYNPVAQDRQDVVTAELSYAKKPASLQVIDKDGNTVPSQIIAGKGDKLTLLFLAKTPSAGLSVYDVRESGEKPAVSSLNVTDNTLENDFFKVTININGDIASIYDKSAQREVLSQPASLQFQKEDPTDWPAWNMYWKDRKNPPIDVMNKEVSIRIAESGPVRVALEITKKGQNSTITQLISLAAGDPGKRIEVRNTIDWQSTGVSLKAAFPTVVQNEQATYGLNTAAIQRSTNNEVKFEVPARQWFDLTDRSNGYGVSILEDGKYGSDKPDNSTVRLTLMFTPEAHQYVYQNSQDWGIHHFTYAIYPHSGDWVHAMSPWQGSFVNAPLAGFETAKHDGPLGKEFSLVRLDRHNVDIMAFKKAEESDYYIVRFSEQYGKDARSVAAGFPGKITDAYEVNGQEQKIGEASFGDGSLHFDMTRFAIRSFAVRFEKASAATVVAVQKQLDLPYNVDVISTDVSRSDGDMSGGLSFPAELIPAEIVSEDVRFKMGSTADGAKNALTANGQIIDLPAGNWNKVYLLAAATHDTTGELSIGRQKVQLGFQDWTGFIGQHYGRILTDHDSRATAITPAFVKGDNIAWYASHRHSSSGNEAYRYSYLYKYALELPKGAKTITLPKNSAIRVFAITVADEGNEEVTPLQPYYENFKNDGVLRQPAPVVATPASAAASVPAGPLAPAVLPGKGLKEFDFFYAGEGKKRNMYIVRNGVVTWSYIDTVGRGEISDAVLLKNGNVLFAHQFGVTLIDRDRKVLWNHEAPEGFEIHTAQLVGGEHVLFVQNGTPAKVIVMNIHTDSVEKEFLLPFKSGTHGQIRHARLTAQGTLLVAHMDLGKVCEYDGNGRTLLSLDVPGVWSAVPLKNGHILVASNGDFVREITRSGKVVWDCPLSALPDYAVTNPQLAVRLANGNTLVNNWFNQWNGEVTQENAPVQAVELTPEKKVVWALRAWDEPVNLGPSTTIQLLDGAGGGEDEKLHFGEIR